MLSFGGAARFGSAHWKLGPIGDYATGRRLAWIDSDTLVSGGDDGVINTWKVSLAGAVPTDHTAFAAWLRKWTTARIQEDGAVASEP